MAGCCSSGFLLSYIISLTPAWLNLHFIFPLEIIILVLMKYGPHVLLNSLI